MTEIEKKIPWEQFEKMLGDYAPKVKGFWEKGGFEPIYSYLKERSKLNNTIYPLAKDVFRSFTECPYKDLRVVFILMEPYSGEYKGIPQADGVAMSSIYSQKIQPSLSTFYKGIELELYEGLNLQWEPSYDLSWLSKQGVLLTNYSLTVEKGKIGSHSSKNLWLDFWIYMIEEVFNKYNNGLIYVLIGAEAKKLEKYILPFNNHIFKMIHPSYSARIQQDWDTNGTFGAINRILKESNGDEIEFLPIIPF